MNASAPSSDQASTKTPVVILLQEGSGAQVIIDPLSHDKFCIGIDHAVEACKNHVRCNEFKGQIKHLMARLGAWVKENRDKLSSAYLAYRPNGELLFVVVQSGVKRDQALSSSLTELDIAIACDDELTDLQVEVLSLPKSSRSSLSAFLSTGEIYEHARPEDASTSSNCEPQSSQSL